MDEKTKAELESTRKRNDELLARILPMEKLLTAQNHMKDSSDDKDTIDKHKNSMEQERDIKEDYDACVAKATTEKKNLLTHDVMSKTVKGEMQALPLIARRSRKNKESELAEEELVELVSDAVMAKARDAAPDVANQDSKQVDSQDATTEMYYEFVRVLRENGWSSLAKGTHPRVIATKGGKAEYISVSSLPVVLDMVLADTTNQYVRVTRRGSDLEMTILECCDHLPSRGEAKDMVTSKATFIKNVKYNFRMRLVRDLMNYKVCPANALREALAWAGKAATRHTGEKLYAEELADKIDGKFKNRFRATNDVDKWMELGWKAWCEVKPDEVETVQTVLIVAETKQKPRGAGGSPKEGFTIPPVKMTEGGAWQKSDFYNSLACLACGKVGHSTVYCRSPEHKKAYEEAIGKTVNWKKGTELEDPPKKQ